MGFASLRFKKSFVPSKDRVGMEFNPFALNVGLLAAVPCVTCLLFPLISLHWLTALDE